jgi:uncharacterized membrane protein
MKMEDIIRVIRRMSVSIAMMLLITYGMATQHPWLQPHWIILVVLGVQFGYQMIKTARSSRKVEANVREASRAKRGVILFKASEREVTRAKENVDTGEMRMGSKMLIMLLVPLTIFIGSGYLLSIIFPGIERWQSYMIGFMLSMPVSTILTFRMGTSPGTMVTTPSSYMVSKTGIAFENLRQSFLLRFPLKQVNVQKTKNYIEVEGETEAPLIPNKLRLFTEKITQLHSILEKNLEAS